MLTSFSRCLKNVSLKCVSSSQKAFCSFLVVQEIFFPQRFVCSNDDCAASLVLDSFGRSLAPFHVTSFSSFCNHVPYAPPMQFYGSRSHDIMDDSVLPKHLFPGPMQPTRRLEHKRSGVQPLVMAVQLIHHMVWSMLMRRSAFSSLHCLCNSAWCRSAST